MWTVYVYWPHATSVYLLSLPMQAMQAKYDGDYARTLSLGTKALCFNIIGGCAHVIFLCAMTFIPIMLRFVFNVI